jgi:hypothetical protein
MHHPEKRNLNRLKQISILARSITKRELEMRGLGEKENAAVGQFLDVKTLVNYRLKLLLSASQKVAGGLQKKLEPQNNHSEKIPPCQQNETILSKGFNEESLFHSGFIRERFINSHTRRHIRNLFIFTRNDSIESIKDLAPFTLLVLCVSTITFIVAHIFPRISSPTEQERSVIRRKFSDCADQVFSRPFHS